MYFTLVFFCITDQLNKEHFDHVKNALLSVASRWKEIGILLGLNKEALNAIENQNKSTESCIDQMVKKWLTESNPTGSATLKRLVEAIAAETGGQNPEHAMTVDMMFQKGEDFG